MRQQNCSPDSVSFLTLAGVNVFQDQRCERAGLDRGVEVERIFIGQHIGLGRPICEYGVHRSVHVVVGDGFRLTWIRDYRMVSSQPGVGVETRGSCSTSCPPSPPLSTRSSACPSTPRSAGISSRRAGRRCRRTRWSSSTSSAPEHTGSAGRRCAALGDNLNRRPRGRTGTFASLQSRYHRWRRRSRRRRQASPTRLRSIAMLLATLS